jgi:hypothetical protein
MLAQVIFRSAGESLPAPDAGLNRFGKMLPEGFKEFIQLTQNKGLVAMQPRFVLFPRENLQGIICISRTASRAASGEQSANGCSLIHFQSLAA